MNKKTDSSFDKRRTEARQTINKIDREAIVKSPKRDGFFKSVYEIAEGDAAKVPWADLKPKDELIQWLDGKSGINLRAVDIACGLGDHAELIADHDYETFGFDISSEAIEWTKKRFPNSAVTYLDADLFSLPLILSGGFDLVWECYTIQALHPDLREKASKAIADMVAPSGSLLVYTRQKENVNLDDGPPWPLSSKEAEYFSTLGFEMISDKQFDVVRPDKTIPHRFTEWRKPDA